ncbi:MAG: HAMP domain-containing sensor histidine kinase [Saprospiraceae bacterium]|nr:HAMP domain-containing sensor histidine kinase [Saprospiraceae bacterium]
MFRQRHHIAILLLSLGLVLLGIFLWLFLKKTWEDESASLRRETNLLFVNAVHSIESQMFDQLIVKRWEGSEGDTSVNISLRLPPPKHGHDSAKVFAFVENRSIVTGRLREKMDTSNTKMEVIIKGDRLPAEAEMSGSLSVLMSTDSSHLAGADSVNSQFLKALEQNFSEAMQRAALPVKWKVSRLDNSYFSSTHAETFQAGQYTDMLSGDRFGAEISNYRSYLFRKTGSQILFSILLFACVGLAFLFVYQSLRQQIRLSEIKNEFIRNMTHELKTPISTVSVAIEALQSFDALGNPARTQEYLAISQLELNRLTLLVDKVLRMSLFEQGDPELKTEALDLRSLVEEVLAAMKLQFEKYRAEVSLSISGTDFSLRGDRLHLISVLYNLLENALKYSPLPPQITINLAHSDRQLTLQVRDQGRGIPTEYLGRIFEKFFRVPTGDVHDVKGHGLGLNYVAGVVSLHHGSIEVESKEGVGTQFTVRLPVNT